MGKRLRLSGEEVDLIYQHRAGDLKNLNYNLSHNSALDDHLLERGIDKKDVISVKHWQNMGGDLRFSVVTKTNVVDEKNVFSNVLKLIEDNAPEYPKIKHKEGKHLLVINPADVHIGKYASARETGEEYNMDIAVARVLSGVSGLINKAKGFGIDRVLFCIGNDILHTDNVMSSTTKGTYQDTDGKWWEHYEVALQVYVHCVEMLREVAPVDCVHSMSNHDYQSGFHLAHALKSWFRKANDVNVDCGVANRKYYKYGSNLNHLHHKIKHKWLDAKDFIGVTVEYMRSPSASDSWHSGKGFCGVPKAVEGFLHDKESGQVARFVHYF